MTIYEFLGAFVKRTILKGQKINSDLGVVSANLWGILMGRKDGKFMF